MLFTCKTDYDSTKLVQQLADSAVHLKSASHSVGRYLMPKFNYAIDLKPKPPSLALLTKHKRIKRVWVVIDGVAQHCESLRQWIASLPLDNSTSSSKVLEVCLKHSSHLHQLSEMLYTRLKNSSTYNDLMHWDINSDEMEYKISEMHIFAIALLESLAGLYLHLRKHTTTYSDPFLLATLIPFEYCSLLDLENRLPGRYQDAFEKAREQLTSGLKENDNDLFSNFISLNK